MEKFGVFCLFVLYATGGVAQGVARAGSDSDFRLTLTDHKGLLRWSAAGFKAVQNSAKPHGRELGVRGRDASGDVTFLGFLFLAPETAPMTSSACRDASLAQERKASAALKILQTSEIAGSGGLPVALATFTSPNRDGSLAYKVQGFVATGDICGDLEFYSLKPISYDDSDLKKVFTGFQLDRDYTPRFSDVAFYAQVLFEGRDYKAAAPIYEKALAMVSPDGSPFKSAIIARRVMRDQAGMSYGIVGEFAKARSVFEKGVAEDPNYPIYYYNLACADAGEGKLSEAKVHLRQAFDRKSNVNPGETMPAPTEDDSFLPYRSDKQFWDFLERLQREK